MKILHDFGKNKAYLRLSSLRFWIFFHLVKMWVRTDQAPNVAHSIQQTILHRTAITELFVSSRLGWETQSQKKSVTIFILQKKM